MPSAVRLAIRRIIMHNLYKQQALPSSAGKASFSCLANGTTMARLRVSRETTKFSLGLWVLGFRGCVRVAGLLDPAILGVFDLWLLAHYCGKHMQQ